MGQAINPDGNVKGGSIAVGGIASVEGQQPCSGPGGAFPQNARLCRALTSRQSSGEASSLSSNQELDEHCESTLWPAQRALSSGWYIFNVVEFRHGLK